MNSAAGYNFRDQDMIRVILFALGTLALLLFSRRAIRNPGAHGFYRFFAFETILALILINQPFWFKEPFSPIHCLSWILLFTSLFFIIHALTILKKKGGYADRADTPENHSFENTAHLVKTGLYRYVRHPMYSSLLFLALGAFLKEVNLLTVTLALLATILLFATGKCEEKENRRFFGPVYAEYMQRSRMFIPWIF